MSAPRRAASLDDPLDALPLQMSTSGARRAAGISTANSVALPWASTCGRLAMPSAAPISSAPSLTGGFSSTGERTSGLAVVVALSLSGAIVVALACSRIYRALAHRRTTQTDALFKKIDAFPMAAPVPKGKSPVNLPSPLGGVVTAVGGIVLVLAAVVLILLRNADNVDSATSLLVLRPDVVLPAAAPFATPAVTLATRSVSGLQVYATVSGEPGACGAPLEWSAGSLLSGTWALDATPVCPGAPLGVTQLRFSCAGCVPGPSSALAFSLHHSCQSVLLEVGAIGADGTLSAYSLPTNMTAAHGGARFAGANWTFFTFLALVNSSVPRPASSRGLMLVDSTSTSVGSSETGSAPRTLSLVPNSAAVSISVVFELQPIYALTMLSEKTSLVQLIANLIGLSGIFSIFGTLYGVAISCQKRVAKEKTGAVETGADGSVAATPLEVRDEGARDERPGSAPFAPAPGALHANSEPAASLEGDFVVDNPLRARAHPPPDHVTTWLRVEKGGKVSFVSSAGETATDAPPGTPVAWTRVHEDGEVWYESATTGETTWAPPLGFGRKGK